MYKPQLFMTKSEKPAQPDHFLPPEEVEKCYGADFAVQLLAHQKELFKDWYAWKRGKGEGLLVRRWIGENTIVGNDGEVTVERVGLNHRIFEDLHMFTSLKMIETQHKLSVVSARIKSSTIYKKLSRNGEAGSDKGEEGKDQELEPLIQNRIAGLNVPLSDDEWKALSQQSEINDLSLRAVIQVILAVAPNRVQEMYDLCVYRILNDTNLVYEAFAVGIFGFTLPLYLLNTIENPTIAASVWFAARSLYSSTLGQDAFKRIHTAGDNDWSIVELLNSIVEENNLNGNLGLSADSMKSAYEGYGRVEWIWGNWPLVASMLGMLASGSFDQLTSALVTIASIKLVFKKAEGILEKKITKRKPKVKANSDDDDEVLSVQKEPFYAQSLVQSRERVEEKRIISRFQTFLAVLFNDATYLLGGIISALSKKSAISTLAGITTVGRLMVQKQLKEVNKEENIAVWRNFNRALSQLNKRSNEPKVKNMSDNLATIMTFEGANIIAGEIAELGKLYTNLASDFRRMIQDTVDSHVLCVGNVIPPIIEKNLIIRQRTIDYSVRHMTQYIIDTAQRFNRESLQKEFKVLGFSDLFCSSCLMLENIGIKNLFFIFLELRRLMSEKKLKYEILDTSINMLNIEFTVDDRNNLFDFILEHVSELLLNEILTDEDLIKLANSLFEDHPSFEQITAFNAKVATQHQVATTMADKAEEVFLVFINEAVEVSIEIQVRYGLNEDDYDRLFSILDEKSKEHTERNTDEVLINLRKYAEEVMRDWNKEPVFTKFINEALGICESFCVNYDLSIIKKGELFEALVGEAADIANGESNEEVLLKLKLLAEQFMKKWGKEKLVEVV
ncbi:hypothetical protein KKD03_00250 [Patescibacteria group bacterium]|nr:hypothetical protein [Patescibacteria group bacterium]